MVIGASAKTATEFARITVDSSQAGGMPYIRSLRLPVATVVRMVADGVPEAEILQTYPGLTGEDIREALQYSAEARRVGELRCEIEADLAASNAYESELVSFADLAREHYSSSDDDAI